MKRLLLAGGGHAQLSVLRHLAKVRPQGGDVVLLTPSAWQTYSGMLPGWMAGHYRAEQCRIDLRPLCAQARVRLVEGRVAAMDADRRCVLLPDGRHLEYDLLSLDVGSDTDTAWLELAGARLLPVKPLEHLLAAWPEVIDAARCTPGFRLVVVGAGAAGVELALAARHALRRQAPGAEVWLAAGESGLLPGHAPGVQRRAARQLQRAGVTVRQQRAAGYPQGLLLTGGEVVEAHVVLAATGARAPGWLALSRLQRDEAGFVAVDAHHRSVSHPNVFAAGDVCSRLDVGLTRSGVHAVHAGPVLAHNLLATLAGEPLMAYAPRRRSLYLLACGGRYAIASWGGFSAEGAWVWRWKDRIDRRFIARFSVHPEGANASKEASWTCSND